MIRAVIGGERGSLAPLGIGLFTFTLGLMVVIVSASSLFIFQKRLTNFSESAALYIAGTGEGTEAFLDFFGPNSFTKLKIKANVAPDDQTIEVTSCAQWVSPMPFIGSLSSTEVCSRALARGE